MLFAANCRLSSALSESDRCARVSHLLRQLSLHKVKDTFVAALSGGERKRVSLAVELIAQTPVIIMDEPTSVC